MVMKRFYSELGKLLYALISINEEISNEEKKKIIESFREEMFSLEHHNDAFGQNVSNYVITEFEFLDEQSADINSSYESFIDYIKEHNTAINQDLKKIILDSARKVVKLGAENNEKGRKMFNELRAILATFRPIKRPRKKISAVRISISEKQKIKPRNLLPLKEEKKNSPND
jgi:hypothetical protein